MDWRGLLYADKPKCRKAAPSKMKYTMTKPTENAEKL